jgi:GTPase SAR1 family protein
VNFRFKDIGGDPLYAKIRDEEIKKSHGCILVFDLFKPDTLEQLYELRDELNHQHRNRHHHKKAYVLVGMKSDLISHFSPRAKGKRLYNVRRAASSFGCRYFELNAFTKNKLCEMFQHILELVYENEHKNEATEHSTMTTQILGAGSTHSEAKYLHNTKLKKGCVLM